MRSQILTLAQEELLKYERTLLGDLRVALVRFGAGPDDQATLDQAIRQLDELFLLVVVGEFNAGKSAFINALLGRDVLAEGVTPTTAAITVVRYGEAEGSSFHDDVQVITARVDLLRQMHIVDTPGTNAILRRHQAITESFVPRSDLVLFVTSADRPFTESERAFLQNIRDWGKKIIVVINKIDIFDSEHELAEVAGFVAENARRLLEITPEIFPVSARLARRARQGEPALWAASRFEPLEQYIHDKLDEAERVRLKLLNPLGVGQRLVDQVLDIANERLALLQADLTILEDVERQLGLYREDMARDFSFRMSDIDALLLEMERRGHDYFDDTIRLGRVFDLLNKSRIQQEFERRVVGDTPRRIEQRVTELIDWLVDADFRQWQSITAHLAERRRQHQERLVGGIGGGEFHYERSRLIESVGREAQRVVDTYDRSREASTIAEHARTAVATSAALGASAAGLGALVTAAASTLAADVTGILVAGFFAAMGFFVIPHRRRRAKQEMRDKLTTLREALGRSLRAQFEQEIGRSVERINESVAPYSRFVRAEREKFAAAHAEFERIRRELLSVRARITQRPVAAS
jgi:small GTP-binding protein